MTELRAFLDNNATTRLAPEALAVMMPYLTDLYVNASSTAGDLMGAGEPIANAKRALAKLFGDDLAADSFLLTSGASEANSWAVHAATSGRPAGHIVTSAIEHPSLLAALEACADNGWQVDLVPPRHTGRLDPLELARRIRPDTALVSVMAANNETGVVQPIADIGKTVRALAPAALFHVDATQAPGRLALSFNDELADVDLMSISAHKFHGPKGIGALFVADGRIPPLIHGSQEGGQRGGTPNTAAAAGMAEAARLALCHIGDTARVRDLRDRFEQKLHRLFPCARVLGADVERLPNTSAFSLPGLEAAEAVEALARVGIAVSSGAACLSGSTAPSHVLTAMGIPYADAKATLRVSLSRHTTDSEMDEALDRIGDILKVRA